jgi:prepilin-type N-terminal cleavage/methylation domain-containing protein
MKDKGFTLVELLVVLALIAILATILIVIIRPAQIFMRGRDTQRQGDLINLSKAVDAYLSEAASNPNLTWPGCNNGSLVYFSTSTNITLPGWPTATSATGTNSTNVNGTGWVPLNFSAVSVLSLNQLFLDPRNGQSGNVNGTSTTFAYSFACDSNNNYEFAAKLESGTSTMANDGGNRNCGTTGPDCLYEVGSGRANLY